jgi:hypothetical protein
MPRGLVWVKNWIALTGFAALLVSGCAARHSFEGAGSGPDTQTLSGKQMGRAVNGPTANPPSAQTDSDSNHAPDALDQLGSPSDLTPVPEDPTDSKPEFILPHNQNELLTI